MNNIAQTVGAEGLEPNVLATSSLCENCFTRVKSTELDEDGAAVTHPYCGIRCYQASQRTALPASNDPAPSPTDDSQDPFKLRVERTDGPVGRKIIFTVQHLWQSERGRTPQVKGIYRIDLPVERYRGFDLALQMNGTCTVTTTYYGGIATCSIANDTDPAPCASDSCMLCAALRNSFGNLLHGASCRDGSYGFGLYTYSNPALAHDVTISGTDPRAQNVNYALVRCSVVTQADYLPSSNSYAGFIDDSGEVFCAQSMAVIPTYLLIYRLSASPNSHRRNTSSNSNSDDIVSAIGSERTEPGGKARANAPFRKTQRQLPPRGASLHRASSQDGAQSYPPPRLDRLASSSYESGRAGSREPTRQSPYPLPGKEDEFVDDESDDDRRITTTSASKYAAGRSKAWNPRIDEDDDDFY
ncbi:hypothetical protein FS837_001154 [Tulasnella sp. UAMH 9824]|nr:hypothetical protein FS837_001154 [Tulasnella sp. UAMH 9824]